MMPLSTHGATRSFPMNSSDALRHVRPLPASLCAAAVLASATAIGQSSGATHHAATSHLVPRRERERPLHVLVGDGSGNFPGFGYSIANLGDVDGDGVADIVVGSPYEGAVGGGTVKVYSGRTGTLLLPAITRSDAWELGVSVAGIGDVDGDGRPDLLVGDPMFNGKAPGASGQAFVFSSATGAMLAHFTGANPADEFGYSVANAGDIDGDGVPDWAVGASQSYDQSVGPGYVSLISAATGATIRTYTTSGFHKLYGNALVNAGDVDGDGVPDLLIGAPGGNFVQMRSGASGALLWQQSGPSLPFCDLGWRVDRAGDWDGDGNPDLVMGAPAAGLVQIRRASDGALLTEIHGPADVYFGGAVAGLGDVDGDGFGDVAIGAKWSSIDSGAAWIYSGRTHGVLASYSGASGDYLGCALAAVGDLNGDGVLDLAIGATQDNNAGPGYVAVYSGAH